MTFVIAAAGTGGHVLPALAIADALTGHGIPRSQIRFVGGDRMEADLVPAAGYSFTGFELARLQRSLTPRNLAIPFVVRRTALRMTEMMEEWGTRAVLGTGGYSVIPAALAARKLRLPFFIQEQNAVAGLATRIAARWAREVFLGLPGKAERLPRSSVIGNPLRSSFEAFDRDALAGLARQRYGVRPDGPVVGILGGSLGARVLNEAAVSIVTAIGRGTVIHITGTNSESQAAAAEAPDGVQWVRLAYETDTSYLYAACDLVVCRAGAMTVSELAATGTPSVLVPLARVGQEANAVALASGGGAVIVPQDAIGGIGDIVASVLFESDRLASMSAAARASARLGAAAKIAAKLREASSD